MNRSTLILMIVLLVVGVAVGAGGMWWVLGGSAEPSEPISAPTLSLDMTEEVDPSATEMAQLRADLDTALGQDAANDSTRVAAVQAMSDELGTLEAQVAEMSTAAASAAMAAEAATEMPEATATPESSATPEPTEVPTEEPTVEVAAASAGRSLFRINAELSDVQFSIHEELFGTPKTVIGSTDQVAGDIIVDFSSAAGSQIGEIRINARTLETDDENRNRALRNNILQSRQDEFEFISFAPTAVTGLPEEPVAVGDSVEFQVTGDLTIRNITNSVTFDVTTTMAEEGRLEGTATTMVTREQYELTIPRAPGVANVSDEVELTINFVAELVESA